jgi:hypothetical protein
VPGIPGKNGTNGTNGAPGAPGEVVLTRVRSTGAATSVTVTTNTTPPLGCLFAPCPDSAHGTVVALTANNWVQAANQINQFFGQITVTPPAHTTCTYYNGSLTQLGLMVGEIDDSATGSPIAYFVATASQSLTPAPVTTPLVVNTLFEPGSTINHALIVKVADNCGAGGNGAVGGGHFTLNSFALDPMGIS